VRIGIVSWNTAALLERCVDSIPAASEGLDADVVVVDNASGDGSAAAMEARGVRVIRNRVNVGYARAINQALTAAGEGRPEVLVALNPDTVAPPGSLTCLVAALLSDPSVGLVVPRLVNDDGTDQHSVYRFPSARLSAVAAALPVAAQRGRLADRWWLEGRADHRRSCDVDWAIGAVHVLRAAAVDPGTPYNERWFMYAEDLDLCWTMAHSGWRRRLVAEVSIVHTGGASALQAFGGRRLDRVMAVSLDWYRFRHGAASTALWCATNALGGGLHLAGALLGARLDGTARPQTEAHRRSMRYHAASLLSRRAAPSQPPGSGSTY
jgi:GT2 family glycosyltransferase